MHSLTIIQNIRAAYMSGSSSVWTLAAYKSSSSLEISTFSPSVSSSLVRTQLGTAQGKHHNYYFNIAETFCCLKHEIPSVISYTQGLCCCMSDCCPPLLLRSCCHPSESPHQQRSSPAADSLLVPLAVEYNIRDDQKNKWMQGWLKKTNLKIESVIEERRHFFSMLLKAAINHRGLHSACTISYQ